MSDNYEQSRRDLLITPPTTAERVQITNAKLAIGQALQNQGVEPIPALLALIHTLAWTLAKFDNPQERKARTDWCQMQLPFYVQAYTEKELKFNA